MTTFYIRMPEDVVGRKKIDDLLNALENNFGTKTYEVIGVVEENLTITPLLSSLAEHVEGAAEAKSPRRLARPAAPKGLPKVSPPTPPPGEKRTPPPMPEPPPSEPVLPSVSLLPSFKRRGRPKKGDRSGDGLMNGSMVK